MNDNSHHSDSSGFSAGLMLGLLLGGAGGYLLSTKEGKKLLENLKSSAGDKLQEFVQNPQVADKLADLEETMKQARQALDSGRDSAIDKVHDVAEKIALETAPDPVKKRNFFFRSGSKLGK